LGSKGLSTKATAYSVDSNEGDSDDDLQLASLTMLYGNSARIRDSADAELAADLEDSLFGEDGGEELSANASMMSFASQTSNVFGTRSNSRRVPTRHRHVEQLYSDDEGDETIEAHSSSHYVIEDLTEQSDHVEAPSEPPPPSVIPVHLVSDSDIRDFVNQERTASLLRQAATLRRTMTTVDPGRVLEAEGDVQSRLSSYQSIINCHPDILLMWSLLGVWPDLSVRSRMNFDPDLFNVMSRYPDFLERLEEEASATFPTPPPVTEEAAHVDHADASMDTSLEERATPIG
jgi:hypothetical protein